MKRIITLLFFIIFSLPLLSQDMFFKIGGNLSNYFGDVEEPKTKELISGFQIGGGLDLPLSDELAFSPEVNLIRKGSKEFYDLAANPASHRFKMWYVSAAILFNIKSENLDCFIKVGPYISYGFSGKKEVSDSGGELIVNVFRNNDYSRLDFGLDFRVHFNLNRDAFELGYVYGISDIDPNRFEKWKNQTVYLNWVFFKRDSEK